MSARAPRARPEFVDAVTGAPSSLKRGGVLSGRLGARISVDGRRVSVDVDESETDRARLSVPILADALPAVLARAHREIKADSRVPFARRDFDGDSGIGDAVLRRIAGRTTFDRPEHAAAMLAELGDWDEHAFNTADADHVREWVREHRIDTGRKTRRGSSGDVEVIKNRRTTSLADTPAGRRILGGRRQEATGGGQFHRALLYLLGQARGSWRAVPWYDVESLLSAANADLDRAGVSPLVLVIPLGAGPGWVDDFAEQVRLQRGDGAAAEWASVQTSAALWRVARDLRSIASPPRGPEGEEFRAMRACLDPSQRRLLSRRIREIEQLAARPWTIPAETCGIQEASYGLPCALEPIHAERRRLFESRCAVSPANPTRSPEAEAADLDDWWAVRADQYADEDEPEPPDPFHLAGDVPETVHERHTRQAETRAGYARNQRASQVQGGLGLEDFDTPTLFRGAR